MSMEGETVERTDMAAKLTSYFHGVKRVVNNMTVEGTESKTK